MLHPDSLLFVCPPPGSLRPQGFVTAAYALSCGTSTLRARRERTRQRLPARIRPRGTTHAAPRLPRPAARPAELFNLFNASHKPKLALEDFAAVYTPLAAAQHRGSSAAAAPDRELREAMDELGAISARAVFEAVSSALCRPAVFAPQQQRPAAIPPWGWGSGPRQGAAAYLQLPRSPPPVPRSASLTARAACLRRPSACWWRRTTSCSSCARS